MNIEIAQCPIHPNFWAIILVDASGVGERITPSECCGNWRQVRKWSLNSDQIDDIIKQFKVWRKRRRKE